MTRAIHLVFLLAALACAQTTPRNPSGVTGGNPVISVGSSAPDPSFCSADSIGLRMDIGAGNAKVLGAYAIHLNPFSETARAPKDWTMEASNDGSSWTTLDTVTNETGWVNEETRTFVCDVVGGAYRYFRLNITANNGDSLTSVAEFYMYEAAAPRYRSYSM
jgi:hypothetical protein